MALIAGLLLVPVIIMAQGGPKHISSGEIKLTSTHGDVAIPWELKGNVHAQPATPPECTATSAGITFAGEQTQVLAGNEPRTLRSTMTITATDGELPASAVLSIWGEATVIYSDTATSSLSQILIGQVVANGEEYHVDLNFAVPPGATSVELAVRGELKCGDVKLASQTQVFVWHPRQFLPAVQNGILIQP